ncbi:hypothetical protein AMAG_05497 [Allomyces macrogynus ATCC 38327]|uniref:EKC/KEOPS complex subunit GON7 n=1 Tax=Allomyces macrogynus (strain ATCC 38327) TaxID=578462 RepID=A0A0L0SCF3_ALLM3|nr:hypothetical protein AMAG_05497 [Allomyces macrogynus ATCC 38327]|eukprot:KNE60065.1 hypothetical protein AMAG_05497 [Allomyces macrogynus ATCC 38327]
MGSTAITTHHATTATTTCRTAHNHVARRRHIHTTRGAAPTASLATATLPTNLAAYPDALLAFQATLNTALTAKMAEYSDAPAAAAAAADAESENDGSDDEDDEDEPGPDDESAAVPMDVVPATTTATGSTMARPAPEEERAQKRPRNQ